MSLARRRQPVPVAIPRPGAGHAGAEYVGAITARESDRRARSAFQALALSLATPGGTLLDFGAGAGLDARCYGEHGLMVWAFDVDPVMCTYFANHCRELIEAGRVELITGNYVEFLAGSSAKGGQPMDLVTANFAPLNLVEDLPGLFRKFHALTAPDGKVLVSVLSPYFIGDLRYSWWWRNTCRLGRVGHYSVPGAQGCIVRRSLGDFAVQCAPYFTLERIYRGLPTRAAGASDGLDWDRHRRSAWLHLTTCRYMFLLFRRQGRGPS